MRLQKTNNHLLFIDGLRATAAIYVAMHHAVLTYFNIDGSGLKQYGALKKVIIEFFFWGHYAVGLFIVLSGFSLMLPVVKSGYFLKGGTLHFYKRRAIRIIPPYYCAIALCLLLITFFIGNKTGSQWDVCIPVSRFDIITHLFMVHDFFMPAISRINHVFWSISVEYRIYLLFPVIVWLWRKKGPAAGVLASVVISAASLVLLLLSSLYIKNISLVSSGVSPYVMLFALGMLAADMSYSQSSFAVSARKIYGSLPGKAKIAAMLCFGVVLLLAKYVFRHYVSPVNISIGVTDVLTGLFFACIIFSCAVRTAQNPWLVKILSMRWLVTAGTFSYSIYLIHAPLLQVIAQYVLAPLHLNAFTAAIVLVTAGTSVVIFLSWLFFLCFEKPFIVMGRHTAAKNIEKAVIINPAP